MHKKLLLSALLLTAMFPVAVAQTNWSQNTACPGWNNPTAFTLGDANNYYSGQLGDRPNQAFDVMTGNTGMTWSTLLSRVQMNTTTVSSCTNSSSYGGIIPDNQKPFAIMTTTSQVQGSPVNRDPNTNGYLPLVPTQYNTMDTTPWFVNTNLTHSIRIGDGCSNSGSDAGAAALYYNTRVTPQNAIMYIYYAVVVQAPGHGKDVDPVFCIRVTKQNPTGGWVQVCDTLAYYISSTPAPNQGITVSGNGGYGDVTLAPNYNTNGWHSNGMTGSNMVFYKDWSKVMLNLSDYMYENIRIEIMISDCAYNAHWAYAYVAGECRPMYISSQGCPAGMSTDVATLMAPLGMSHYQWSASNMGVSDPVIRLNPGGDDDWFTFRDLTNPLTEAQGGYIYNVQASDFKVNYRPNQSHALIQPTDSLGQVVDSFGNRQTFRCRMTSALDPDKPYSSDLYINVTNTKPTMQIDSLAFCDGNVRLWNRSYVPGTPGLVVDSNTMWWMYSDPACTGTPLDTLRGDSISYNFGDTNLHGFIVRSMTLDSNCYSDAKYTIKPPSKYTSDTSATAIGHFLWHGTTYTTSGDYPDTLTAHEGCDSIVTLHLTISPDTHSYVNMGDDLLWATCNIGADNPWDYGDYFAWGETSPKSTYSWENYIWGRGGSNITRYNNSDHITTLLPEDDAATANWGSDWRMPTREELTALCDTNKYSHVWITNYNGTGKKGLLITRLTGPCAGNNIFFPAAGSRTNQNNYTNITGIYRSSSLTNIENAYNFSIDLNIGYHIYSNQRYIGYSVRAVMPAPTYTVAAASGNDTMGNAGVLVITPGAPAATSEPSMNVGFGETVSLSATPNQGYHFVCWMEADTLYSRTADTVATILGNRSFTALFAPDMADIVLTNLTCGMVGNKLKIEYQYANQGEVDYTTTVGFTVYRNHYRGEVVGRAPLMYSDDDMLASSGNIETRSYLYGRMIICRLEPEDSLVVAINDMGLGVARHANAQPESDTLNNIAVLHINGVFPDRHVYSVDEQAVCDSLTWIDDSTYRASTDTAYYTVVTNYQGSLCDSVVRLDLTVSHSTASDTVAVVCDSMQWHGQTYTANAEPALLLQAANADGCDSTVTLHLTVNHSSTSDTTVHAVNHYTWNGTEYTTGGDIQDSLYTAEGCDSLATLHLTLDYIDTITLAVNDTNMGSIEMLYAFTPLDTVDLSTIHSNYTVQDGTVLTGTLGGNHKISIAAGASVMLKGVSINRIEQNNNNPRPGQGGNQSTPTYLWAGLSLLGDATIVLDDSNYVKGFNSKYPGIHVPAGSTLTIRGEGILTASPGEKTSSPYFEASAIGGGYLISNGNIVIESGTIHAHGNYAAGIGGGYSGNPPKTCGNITIRGGNIDASSIGCGDSETIDSITISGGTVIATGNDFEAGIGSGNFGTVNHIVITGGTVIANGGYRASGIGGGGSGHCGEVVIDSTVTLVTSTGGRDCPNHIGAGTWSTVDTVIVAGQGYTNIDTPFSYTGNGTNDNFTQPLVFAIDSNSYIIQRGKRVVVQATPKPNHYLAEWSDSAAVNADNTDTLTVNGSMLLTAIFAHDPYNIGAAAKDTAMGSAMVVYNDSVASRLPVEPDSVCSIVATPKFGYHFVRWEEADSLYSRTADTSVTATSNRFFYAVFERTYDTITLAVNDTSMGSISLQTAFTYIDTVNLDTIQSDYTVQDGTVLTGTLGGIYKISVAAGASVMLSDMDITGVHNDNYTWAGLSLLGNATIVLDENTTNHIRGFHYHYPGIHVPAGSTLTIRGSGELTAEAGTRENYTYQHMAAGIGGGYEIGNGNIVIEGGTIYSHGYYAAGIGGGFHGQNCGNITIRGGYIDASSIGSGDSETIDSITITGGTVIATGNNFEAGIGIGNFGTVNHIVITGGTVIAQGGNAAPGIGGAAHGHCGEIVIDSTVTLVTSIAGQDCTTHIGAGTYSTFDTIIVAGQGYTDVTTSFSYTGNGTGDQSSYAQPMIIGIGGNSYRIARGTTVNISAIPNSIYYRLANWTEADTVYSRTADTAVTITPNRTLTAVFESNLQHITVNSSEGGNGHVAAACENFDSYTVGNHVAAEAIAHGNNSWTTWYRAPGSDADGTIANINGSNCAHFVRGNDQVMLFGDIADGVYDLEFDLMVPNGKDGYFNVLHHFDGSNSYRAIETYLHLYREYNLTKTPTPGFGDVYAGQEHAAVMPCVYDTWVHFRVHVDFDVDSAQLYYSLPGESDTLIHSWQWSLDASGWNSYYNHLSAIDFYPAHSDSTSEFYVDNIVLNRSNNNYPRGTQCNLTATPDEHYHFVCWMEAGTVYSRSADTVINVTGDRTFTALFAIDQHYIATACNDTSMGSTSVEIGGAPSQGNSTFAVADYGTTATITATPKFGYHFVRWEEDTSLYSRAADTTVDVTADRYFYAVFERTYDTVTLMVNDTSMGSIALHGAFTPTDTVNLDTIQGDYTVQDGTVLTGTLGGNYKISVAAGASVMLSNMNITGVHDSSYMWAGLSLLGDATIVLDDSTTNYIKGFFFKYPGIHVPAGATLTIRGNGELTAHSGKNGSLRYAAGIGGGYDVPSGSIVIENGIITTLGGYGASLGGGYNTQRRACGNIAIHGGTISATCIGGGYNALIDSVLITGGSITARASVNQPGIGCDGSGILNHLIITGGTINATGGSNGAGIGGGRSVTVNHITITGGTITATGGHLAAGIGSGSYNGHCGEIVIASSVTSVTAIKGYGSTQNQNIGSGESGTCDTVIVGGQPYTDDPNASSYTFVGDGSTPQDNFTQPTVIAIGDNIYRIARGTTVVVQATPKTSYHLAEWSDSTAVNADNTDTLMVDGSTWLMAIFERNPYLISAASVDTTMGSAVVIYDDSVAATLPVLPDSTFILEATANPCYHFVCWTKGADTVASESIIELQATDTSFYMAHFERNLPLLGDTTAVVCDSLVWFGTAYTATDSATHNLLTAEGCDSTVTLHLTVKYSSTGDTTAEVCDLFMWYDSIYTATSAPTHRLANAVGCDSTVTLNLTVNYKNTGDTVAVVCDSFAWYGDTYTASNDSLTHFMEAANQWGCDSTVILHLTVNYQNTGDTTAVECDQFSWYEHQGLTASTDTLTHLLADQWGCDSTVTLHLTVNYQNTGDTTAVECDQYTWYEHTRVTASTDTLTHLFASANQWGCDSTVTLHLTVNYQNTGDTAAVECDQFSWYEHQNMTVSDSTRTHLFAGANQWGCDSTVTLHLTVNYQNTGDTTAVECDQFSWYEHQNMTASDSTRTHLFVGANQWGCDSTVTLHLTVNYQNTGDTAAVVCDSLVWYDSTYTLTAAPTHVFANQWGCDSTVTLSLTVNYSSTSDTTAVECDQFAWNGTTYTASGEPERHYTNAVGCDSTRTLHLTINYQNTGDTTAVECDQFSWYEHDSLTASSNTLTHLFQGANQWGCDSTVTLNLTVNYKNTGDTTIVACDQYSWYEHTGLTASVDTLKHLFVGGNRWGCDSTTTLHLTVNYQNTGDTTAVECDHFTWYQHHNLSTSSDNRTHRFVGANQWGCDSTVTLHLTVNYSNTGDTTAVECDLFSWYEHQNLTSSSNNKTHRLVGANQWGCDSTVTLHLTVNYQNTGDTSAVTYEPFTWYEHTNMGSTQNVQHTFAGSNRWGCDSTVTLHLRYALFTTSWSGATTVTYNSQPQNVISATYVDDTGRVQQAALTFTNGTEVISTPNYPVGAGVWAVVARPMLPVDSLSAATTTLTILPATVSVSGAVVRTAKVIDGTTAAEVIDPGVLNNIQGSDPLTHTTTAEFSDATVGQDKTITLTYTLHGDADLLSNYTLQRTTEVYSTLGAIVDPIEPDPQHTFDLAEYGYCTGSGAIGYHLSAGTPDQYKIDFADSRIADVDWTNLATTEPDGTINIDIPEGLPMGDYSMSVTFRNSSYTWIESAPMALTIHVNLPASYTKPLFYNVIILIDTCECITDVQWYHREVGGEWAAIPGANDYNYRQVAGLTGEYFAKVKMNGVETYTCPQGDLVTLVRDEHPAAPTISAHPNPTTNTVTVELTDPSSRSHLLRVINTTGVEMERRTFDGNTTTIEMSQWQSGSYIVSVDGLIVRVIKK